jgi:hypothetical protein
MTAPPRLKLTGSRCLCRGCGEYFNSVGAFDCHRTGRHVPINQPSQRRCLTVAEMRDKGWLLNDAGFWITGRLPSFDRKPRVLANTARAGAAIGTDPLPEYGVSA